MNRNWAAAALPVLLCAAVVAGPADANGRRKPEIVRAQLIGYNEVPSISTRGRGWFRATIDEDSGLITYTLFYSRLVGDVAQAHLHFGQHHTNGGISVFLCSNLGNGPAGTQACPPGPAEISGTIMAADVIGPARQEGPPVVIGQGIEPGQFDELLDAIRAGAVYANVHSSTFPGGEIRGQLQ